MALGYLGVGFAVLGYMLLSGLAREDGIEILSVATILRVVTFGIALAGGVVFLRRNPGVASISAPIINETELKAIREYCLL